MGIETYEEIQFMEVDNVEPKQQKVVLVSPPTTTHRTPEEHLGIELLASEVECAGHSVAILDSWLEELDVEGTVDSLINISESEGIDVVGFSPSMDSDENTLRITRELRERGYNGKIIIGGFNATFELEKYLLSGNGVDLVFRGEADLSFPNFLNRLACNVNWRETPGVAYIKEGEIIQTENPEYVENLDSLPDPKRIYLEKMKRLKVPAHVSDSRGCWNRCGFCSIGKLHDITGVDKRWRGRSSKSLARELFSLQKSGVTHVKFLGDTFFGGRDWKKRSLDLCEEMDKLGVSLKFRMSTRVDTVEEETFRVLKEHGLFAVSLGAESGVQRKLDAWNKNTTVEENLRAVKILEDLGIYVQMGFILIDPWVTIEEMEEEVEFLERTRWVVTKGICTSLFAAEGTPITEQIKESVEGLRKEGSNYIYEVQNPKAREVHEALRLWSRSNSEIYDRAIDPISAPKAIPDEYYKEFHELCVQLKDRDIQIFSDLIRLSKEDVELGPYINQTIIDVEEENARISERIEKLYALSGLKYNPSINNYIY
jgi:radical SAM superfamily enzyme YgiQ (UPF0313 family)